MQIEFRYGLIEFAAKFQNVLIELGDGLLRNQANAGFRIRQRHGLPVRDRSAPDGGYGFEGRMRRIQQLFTGRQKLTFRAKRISRLILLG